MISVVLGGRMISVREEGGRMMSVGSGVEE